MTQDITASTPTRSILVFYNTTFILEKAFM